MKRYRIQTILKESNTVIDTRYASTLTAAENIENGLLLLLNLKKYTTRIVDTEAKNAKA